ncbi:MAG TPA: N-6 DNA methylase [Candidatus Polarisedimenticolia bacterium]|jgi:hypothetical protein
MDPLELAGGQARDDDVDCLGPAIERELDPAARRRAGQHFTRADVADLITAFCVRTPADRVLDPACGAGVFLMRARARARFLARAAPGSAGPGLTGVERDRRLARAAGVNLPEAAILAEDFLTVDSCRLESGGPFDAVVGNPPYVRHELLGASRKRALEEASLTGPFRQSRRSDLHLYFWPRMIALLRDGGRLGLLTSNTWLDAEYGEPLRRWLAGRFTIVAIIESESESWFDDARVRTSITILEKSPPSGRPPARLVRLERDLAEMVPAGLPAPERVARFDEIASEIERGRVSSGRVRTRSVPSAGLTGAPWGPALRMPDLYFEILERAGDRLVPLSQVAEVSWGIKTGDDAVFFLGAGEGLEIESRFLVPVVFNLMDLDRLIVTDDQLERRLLAVDLRNEGAGWRASAPRLYRYLGRAQRDRGSHLRPTCAARENGAPDSRRWFELRPGPPAQILWSIMHQYRHLAPLNPSGFPSNDNLLKIRARSGVEPRLLAALLNSHVQALIKLAHGRHRNEGMLKTQGADVRRMPVPDPRRLDARAAERVTDALDVIARRGIGRIPEECARPDRRALDLAVLAALGYGKDEAGATVDKLHETLIESCRRERRWEIDAVTRRRRRRAPRSASARAGRGPGFPR